MNAEPVLKMSVRLGIIAVLCFAGAALPDSVALLGWMILFGAWIAAPVVLVMAIREMNAAGKQAASAQRAQGQAHRSYVPHGQTGKYAGYKRVI